MAPSRRPTQSFEFELPLPVPLARFKERVRKVHRGDFFAINLLGERWLLGRVVEERAFPHLLGGGPLVYIYKHDVSPPFDLSRPIAPDLVWPPTAVIKSAWSSGWFLALETQPLRPGELLNRHVFYLRASSGQFIDALDQPVEPPQLGDMCAAPGLASAGYLGARLLMFFGYSTEQLDQQSDGNRPMAIFSTRSNN